MKDIIEGISFIFGMTLFIVCGSLILIFIGGEIFSLLLFIRQYSEAAAIALGIALLICGMYVGFMIWSHGMRLGRKS